MTRRLPEEAWVAALVRAGVASPAALRRLLGAEPPMALWRRACAGELDGDRGQPSRRARGLEVGDLWEAHRRAGVEVDLFDRPGFPGRLSEEAEGPAVLFRRGQPGCLADGPVVALVGTRQATRYGLSLAARLGAELAAAGVVVVTGLTPGVDAAAHEGALAGRGRTEVARSPVALVAGPLERPEAGCARLLDRAATSGAVLSEVPVGVRAVPPWRFARRNRLLGVLADVVVVVESHARGRALAVAQAAAERGRTVGAVPGSVRSPASVGANDLLAEGSLVIRDTTDVLVALSLARASEVPVRPTGRHAAARRRSQLGPRVQSEVGLASAAESRPGASGPGEVGGSQESLVLETLGYEPCSMEEVLRRTGLDLAGASAALEGLRAAGLVRGQAGWWERD